MQSKWRISSLSELTTKITKGTTPSKKDGGFSSSGINYIKAESVGHDGRVDNTKFSFISISVHEKLKRSQLELNDILFSMAGVHLGKSGIVEDKHLPANTNQALALIRPNQDVIYPKYLHYFLQQKSMVRFVNNSTSQSAQPNINLADIGNLKIRFPEFDIQKKIIHILSTLDDKIELNLKMNQTLEEMAQALFKSWFVDFEPVHAKANAISNADFDRIAKELGISREILDLFPDEFVESELGTIPKGWNTSSIKDNLDVILGGTPSRSNDSFWTDGTVSWINSGKVNEFRIIECSENITEEAVRKSSTRMLPKKTTVLAITGATLGQVSLLEIDSCANQSVIGLPETNELNHSFIYPCISHAIQELISHQTGGAQQHINKGNVEDYSIIIPNEIVLKNYVSIAKPLMNTISNNSLEIQTLQKTRDTLLPRLLSGELDVSELELDNVTH